MNKLVKKTTLYAVCITAALLTAACGSRTQPEGVQVQPDISQAQITIEDAEAKALSDAGITASGVSSIETKIGQEGNDSVYAVKFYAADTKYEYGINASTGEILSRSRETLAQDKIQPEEIRPETQPPETQQEIQSGVGQTEEIQPDNQAAPRSALDSAGQITLEEAKKAALSDAGLTESDVTYTQEKLDYEDGIAVYEIEFYTSSYEYEYEIDASSGAVYSKSVDAVYTGHYPGSHRGGHNGEHY